MKTTLSSKEFILLLDKVFTEFKEIFKEEEVEEKVEKLYVSYDKIQKCISTASKIDEIDTILCVTRGGLVPSGMLAYALNVKNIVNISASSYNDDHSQEDTVTISKLSKKEIKKLNNAKHILIVDDIIDSGNTIRAVSDYLRENIEEVNTKYSVFSIVTKDTTLNDYYCYDATGDDRWIVFPWDNE